MNADICIIGFLGAGVSSLLVGLSVWRRRTAPETGWLALLAATAGLWGLAVAMEILHHRSVPQTDWTLAADGIMLVVPVLWLLFALRGSGMGDDRFLRILPILLTPLFLLSLIILTNPGHKLVLSAIGPAGSLEGGRILASHGPFFRVNAVYTHIMILAGSILSARRFLRFRPDSAGKTLAAAAFLPWGVNAFILSGLSPCGADITPLAFAVTAGIIFVFFLRSRILDMAPFARDLLFREMEDGVLVLDSRGRLVTMNPAAEKALGVSMDALGKPAEVVLAHWTGLVEHCRVVDEAEPSLGVEASFDGKWYDVRISPIRGNMGRVKGKMLVFRDIGIRKRMEDELLQYATMDPLTDVFNRRMGLTVLEKQLRLSERNGTGLAVCYVDIDGLKAVNDNYGHSEGDFLIRSVSEALKSALRDSDVLCRLGGDEFLMILPDCTRVQGEAVFRRVEEKLARSREKSGKPYRFGISRGFAEYLPGSGVGSGALLSLADEEMYRDKVRNRAK